MGRVKKKLALEQEESVIDEDYKSKSAKKRDSIALQKLGEELVDFSREERASLGLSEELLEALTLYDKLTDKEAKRRQRQFIGKLMREVDAEAIERAKNLRYAGKIAQDANFQAAVKLREKLMEVSEDKLNVELERIFANEPELKEEALNKVIIARGRSDNPESKRAWRELFRLILKSVENNC